MKSYGETGAAVIMTAVIVSVVAIVVAVSLGFGGFLGRFDALNIENKSVSYYLAKGCAEKAVLSVFSSSSYAGNESVAVASSSCSILPVVVSSSNRIIKTTASAGGSVSNLETTVDTATLKIVSARETAGF